MLHSFCWVCSHATSCHLKPFFFCVAGTTFWFGRLIIGLKQRHLSDQLFCDVEGYLRYTKCENQTHHLTKGYWWHWLSWFQCETTKHKQEDLWLTDKSGSSRHTLGVSPYMRRRFHRGSARWCAFCCFSWESCFSLMLMAYSPNMPCLSATTEAVDTWTSFNELLQS